MFELLYLNFLLKSLSSQLLLFSQFYWRLLNFLVIVLLLSHKMTLNSLIFIENRNTKCSDSTSCSWVISVQTDIRFRLPPIALHYTSLIWPLLLTTYLLVLSVIESLMCPTPSFIENYVTHSTKIDRNRKQSWLLFPINLPLFSTPLFNIFSILI